MFGVQISLIKAEILVKCTFAVWPSAAEARTLSRLHGAKAQRRLRSGMLKPTGERENPFQLHICHLSRFVLGYSPMTMLLGI